MKRLPILALSLSVPLLASAGGLHSHSGGHHSPQARESGEHGAMNRFGRPGEPGKVVREVEVVMNDTMRFTPSTLAFRAGETVRFRVRNEGAIRHEMVLGDPVMVARHAEEMRRSGGAMDHDDPNMVSLAPGESGELVWEFTGRGAFIFACLVPGHLEAGMKGDIRVE